MKIPNVDVTNLEKAGPSIAKALKETGFVVISVHGIPDFRFKNTYEVWEAFFSHPTWKNRHLRESPSQAGYFHMGAEKAKEAKVSDLKEFYHYFGNTDQILPSLPITLKHRSRLAFQMMEYLAGRLLKVIQDATPQDTIKSVGSWTDHVNQSSNTLLRILHYPPIPEMYKEGAVRASAHEDINLITLLPAATQPGLQVQDNAGLWHDVDVESDNSIIINAGDMLQEATGGYYKSTTHRVVNPEGENVSRYSMPLFLHPHPETVLSERHTAKSYLTERLKELGII